jgi:hypothetical protein
MQCGYKSSEDGSKFFGKEKREAFGMLGELQYASTESWKCRAVASPFFLQELLQGHHHSVP